VSREAAQVQGAAIIAPAERERIRAALFAGLAREAKPRLYAMAGIPGAGKSTFVAKARAEGLFPRAAFILNPDIVMEEIAEYRRDYEALGAAPAFARWEMPARELAYALAREAAAQRFPIIKDMGMARAENWRMLSDFKTRHGYAVELHAIRCPLDLALAGCASRARYFPEAQVRAREAALERLLAEYAHVPERIFRYERTGQGFRQVDEARG
jgi:predicted kinase